MACEIENADMIEIMCDHGQSLVVKNSRNQTPLMFSSTRQKQDIVNYLSLRAQNLDTEDDNHITLLVYQLLREQYIMA